MQPLNEQLHGIWIRNYKQGWDLFPLPSMLRMIPPWVIALVLAKIYGTVADEYQQHNVDNIVQIWPWR